jgi:hypothetical protein
MNILLGFSHTHTSYSDHISREWRQCVDRLLTEILIQSSLNNRNENSSALFIFGLKILICSLGSIVRCSHLTLVFFARNSRRATHIQHHHNIRPQSDLGIYDIFRREHTHLPIIRTTKSHSIRKQFGKGFGLFMASLGKGGVRRTVGFFGSQRKRLKTTTIRQDQSWPTFKRMQSSRFLNNIRSWTQIQMKRIRQDQIDWLQISS